MSYVYVILHGVDIQTMRVKIGVSRNIDSRLEGYRTAGHPCLLALYPFATGSGKAESFEKHCHAAMQQYRHYGEWYDLPADYRHLFLHPFELLILLDQHDRFQPLYMPNTYLDYAGEKAEDLYNRYAERYM